MKNNEATIFIFIASIIIGILITSNFNLNKTTTRVILNAKQYQSDYNYRNTLVSEVSALKNKYIDLLNKTEKFQKSDKSDKDIEAEINEELYNARLLAGTTDVQGSGIRITINDGTDELGKTTVSSNNDIMKILHNYDLLQILNDLKFAGAEAISINGQRIISNSEVSCSGPFLQINGDEIPSPYSILVIGNKEKLRNYENSDSNLLYILSNIRGMSVTIKESDNIVIRKYNGSISHKYMKQANNKIK